MMSSKMSVLMMITVAAMVAAMAVAQTPTSDCASKLVPCANYLNSTNPPPSCCDPLRQAVTNELPCLCNLYSTPGLLPSLGINITQALRLPGYCKIPGDLNACKNLGVPGPSSLPSPPGVPGGNDGNGVGKMSWSGMSSLVLLLASLMLN